MALIDREYVLNGKGFVFINGIPFAYATSFELTGTWEQSGLARSHATIPDRYFIKDANWGLTITVKQLFVKKHLVDFYTALTSSSSTVLKARYIEGMTSSSGSITFDNLITSAESSAGWNVENLDAVPLIISTSTSKFDLYIESGTATTDLDGNIDVSFTGLPANAQVKAYFILYRTGERVIFNINTVPNPVNVKAMFIDYDKGQVGIEVFKAIPKNLKLSGLGDDFQEIPMEFQVLGNEKGEVFGIFHEL